MLNQSTELKPEEDADEDEEKEEEEKEKEGNNGHVGDESSEQFPFHPNEYNLPQTSSCMLPCPFFVPLHPQTRHLICNRSTKALHLCMSHSPGSCHYKELLQ